MIYQVSAFWQSTQAEMTATLIHEFAHIANGAKTDQQFQDALGIKVGADDTWNISTEIASKCF